MMEPEHKNSMALKNACMEICRKASCGWFRPMVTIIRPSWLDVEKAMIFLMSFWVSAQKAVNSVVVAPKHRQIERAVLFVDRIGLMRINKKMPATTIVLECSSAETGVGPSIAAGSHGCRPNWADFPVAARINPRSGSNGMGLVCVKICCNSHVFRFVANQAMLRINPMSPARL